MIGALVLAACGTSEVSPAASGLASEWLPSVSGTQAEIIADGRVSDDEYEAALNATRQCLEAEGITAGPITDTPDGFRRAFFVETDEDDSIKMWQQCATANHVAVESVFLSQLALPPEEHAKAKDELVGCLNGVGVADVTAEMSDADIAKALATQDAPVEAWVCRERFLILTGVVGARPPER